MHRVAIKKEIMTMPDTTYSKETQSALIDSKIILDCVLYDDQYHSTLRLINVDRSDVDAVWKILENIIYEQKVDWSAETGVKNEFDTTDDEQVWEALHRVYDMINGIDEPWLWTEYEDDMSTMIDTLAYRIGGGDWVDEG